MSTEFGDDRTILKAQPVRLSHRHSSLPPFFELKKKGREKKNRNDDILIDRWMIIRLMDGWMVRISSCGSHAVSFVAL